jgi:hypothetical protein
MIQQGTATATRVRAEEARDRTSSPLVARCRSQRRRAAVASPSSPGGPGARPAAPPTARRPCPQLRRTMLLPLARATPCGADGRDVQVLEQRDWEPRRQQVTFLAIPASSAAQNLSAALHVWIFSPHFAKHASSTLLIASAD